MPITKPEKDKKRGGRPKSEIDERAFNALCKIQCTLVEICSVLGVDTKTLMLWCKQQYGKSFSALYKERRALGHVSLRRMQWKTAEDGNPTMQIWLGRNYLHQSEDGLLDQEDNDHIPTKVVLQAYDASGKGQGNGTSV